MYVAAPVNNFCLTFIQKFLHFNSFLEQFTHATTSDTSLSNTQKKWPLLKILPCPNIDPGDVFAAYRCLCSK